MKQKGCLSLSNPSFIGFVPIVFPSTPIPNLQHLRGSDSYYSLYGHMEIMAREVQRGANAVQGVEATLWQVPEILPDKVLDKMKAPPKVEDVPMISPQQLKEANGFIFGFPSRFGMMTAQFKAFFDDTHELWASRALAGKPAGIFWSTGFHGGGQEITAINELINYNSNQVSSQAGKTPIEEGDCYFDGCNQRC